jgi:hypothetical protein
MGVPMNRPAALLISMLVTASIEASEVRYAILGSDGAQLGEGTIDGGRLSAPLGGAVRFTCNACGFTVVDIGGAFINQLTCTDTKPTCGRITLNATKLPIVLWSGADTPIEKPGVVVLKVGTPDVTTAGKATGSAETVVVDFGGSERWWQVTDTFAYAVTRDSGNTAIAGAGVFVNVPKWLVPFRALRDQLRYSVVVHLLPPVGGESPADLGIAPIGFGLFGNRVVFGVGWNVSRRGIRPTSHNQYFYVGFSASQVLRAGNSRGGG